MRTAVLVMLLAAAPGQAPDRPQAIALLSSAERASDEGRYAEARDLARRAATIASALGDRATLAIARNRAGLASLYAGSYAEAGEDFRAAADLSATLGDPEGRAETLGNLANVQFFLGKYADASSLYDEALKITAEAAAAPWAERRRRILLANQASLYQRLGRERDALAIYQALGSGPASLEPREQALLLVNLGVLYRRLGDPIKALDAYDRARGLFAADRDVDGELGAITNRGIVLASDLARLPEAEAAFGEALASATRAGNRREMAHARLYRGETLMRAGDPARARADFGEALAMARALKIPEEEWKALFGLGRATPGPPGVALLADAVGVIEQLRENIRVPSLRVEFLNDKREVYDALIAARLDGAPPGEIFELLERSHSRGWRERLGLPGSIQLRDVQSALPPGGLLLDYWQAGQGAAVVAVTKNRAGVFRIEMPREPVQALMDALGSGPSAPWRDAAARLSALLPPPDWFDGVAHLVVVPDGAIALVPFDVLTLRGRMIVESIPIGYTPTAATLLRRPAGGDGLHAPWTPALLAFADPVVGTARANEGAEAPARLRAAEPEVRRIAAELAGRATLHVGPDDRKAYLSAGGGAPILHLATHATADLHAIERSRLVFSPAGTGEAPDYLFLREAYDLPLGDVELAVLSACETERGPMTRAEGVQSFSRAFLAAGARSTVTTLWRVADGPTADFMAVFYDRLQAGLTRDEALRRAKLRFIRSGTGLADPHYWAAFVLTGDAARPAPRAVSWMMLGAIGFGAVLLLSAIWIGASRRQ